MDRQVGGVCVCVALDVTKHLWADGEHDICMLGTDVHAER